MLHGGLRYLEHEHFSLVRESSRTCTREPDGARGLARPQRFLVPLYRGDR